MTSNTVLTAQNLHKSYRLRSGRVVEAVRDVSLSVGAGETLGIVGESGSGKSTLARILVGLATPDSGTVTVPLQSKNIDKRSATGQIVFQDPRGSLDPRFTVGRTVAEPLRALGWSKTAAIEGTEQLLSQVGIDPTQANRYPNQFSGGQRQRVAVARALASSPNFVVLDEPTSALDVSVQARLLDLLVEIQEETGVAFILVSHDLPVVRHLAHHVAVMQNGQFVETGPAEQVFTAPTSSYGKSLVNSLLPAPQLLSAIAS